ncbi:hypothetical protein NCTGTJJY_CDS0088 [Serratia phage 92A1]|nr:hypothetical protein NCTGTJJY_CDS0088 [Serratia phage 92A1]
MLKQIIKNMIEENQRAYEKRRAQIISKAEVLNSGWSPNQYSRAGMDSFSPTWGKDDRPHAPFDGYLWEHPVTGSIDEYGGGQYLPYIDDFERMDKPEFTGDFGWWKLRLTSSMLEQLKEISGVQTQEPYKEWPLGKHTIVMAKVRAHASVLDAIKDFSEQFFNDYYANLKTEKGIAPVDKQTITGRIVFTKIEEGFYGDSIKMMVELPNKSTVYGTLPKCIPADHRGNIEFTATFTHKNGDNTHAYYKRPTKASVC